MIKKPPTTIPLFSVGDLVKIRGFGILLAQSDIEIGIIANGPYSYCGRKNHTANFAISSGG